MCYSTLVRLRTSAIFVSLVLKITCLCFSSPQMGYAQMQQRGHGLHLRQFSRAFIVDDGAKRVAFVSVDGAMISHPLKRDVSMIALAWHDRKSFTFLTPNLLIRLGSEEIATPLWKYLSNGKCYFERNAHSRHSRWIHDAPSVRHVDVWLCARNLWSSGAWNFQGKRFTCHSNESIQKLISMLIFSTRAS